MDFIDELKLLGEKVTRLKEQILTEEATKTAFILPFINMLGYDVFNPLEVIPEYTADIGIKKGEKVDYCLIKDSTPVLIIECKWWGEDINLHNSQLLRYFNVTNCRFGLLTNGILYKFYTDLDESNKMDAKPFLEFNITDIKDNLVPELKKFHKTSFNVDEILGSANELKYAKEIRTIMNEMLANPSDDFVKFFASQIYKGLLTQKLKAMFAPIVKRSLTNLISDMISERLKTALNNENKVQLDATSPMAEAVNAIKNIEKENKIETTEEEMEAYFIVKSMLRPIVTSQRITFRDTQSYFSILLDDNNRNTICRLYTGGKHKYLGVYDANKKENKIAIENLDDIYNYFEILKEAVMRCTDKKHTLKAEQI